MRGIFIVCNVACLAEWARVAFLRLKQTVDEPQQSDFSLTQKIHDFGLRFKQHGFNCGAPQEYTNEIPRSYQKKKQYVMVVLETKSI